MGSEKALGCLYMESNTIVEYSDVNINKNRMGFHGYGDVYSFFKVVMACVRDPAVSVYGIEYHQTGSRSE